MSSWLTAICRSASDGQMGTTIGKGPCGQRIAARPARHKTNVSQNGGASLRPLGPYRLLRFDQISRANSLLASDGVA